MAMDKQKVDNYVDELINVINQKQSEIDELLEFINRNVDSFSYSNYKKAKGLIQKHTKK